MVASLRQINCIGSGHLKSLLLYTAFSVGIASGQGHSFARSHAARMSACQIPPRNLQKNPSGNLRGKTRIRYGTASQNRRSVRVVNMLC